MIKLGVNVDHVATLRQARGGKVPSPCEAALEAQRGGADGITVHLREDRRHIQDHDVLEIKKKIRVPLNLEMAFSPAIVKFALRIAPEKVCIVPEKRQEVTTEGGLDVYANEALFKQWIPKFRQRKIQVSMFIEPSPEQVHASYRVKAHAIEIHTGTFANATGAKKMKEFKRIEKAAHHAG